jgi:hypothetical protein
MRITMADRLARAGRLIVSRHEIISGACVVSSRVIA